MPNFHKPDIYIYEYLLLIFFSIIGFISSLGLLMSELTHLSNPKEALGCDLNPLIGCSSSISSWQAHLFFGIPNSVIGLVVFTILITIFLLLFLNMVMPNWVWKILFVGTSSGVVWVIWFLWISVFDFKKLCPFCLVLWFSVIILHAIITGIVFRNSVLFKNETVNFIFGKYRFYFALILLLSMLVFILFGMMDTWVLVLK